MIAKPRVSLVSKIFATCVGACLVTAGLLGFISIYYVLSRNPSMDLALRWNGLILTISFGFAYTCFGGAILLGTWQKTWTREFFIATGLSALMFIPFAYETYRFHLVH